ncbi:MAG TPA: hypothetical protein VI636_14215 [Candidatus Angelobacter sp.]
MSNISIIIVVLLSVLTITLLVVGYRSRRKQTAEKPIDLTAFRTLIDRDHDAFLREKLSRVEFFHQKRRKIRVTWKYVRRMADNAAVFMRLASEQRTSSDQTVAETAQQIGEQAAQLRLNCLVAFAKLTVEFAIPSVQLTPAMLAPKYETLKQNLSRLGSLHQPLASAM